jgi:signal transduction histidine kinase
MDPFRRPLLKRLRAPHWVAIDCAFTALMALVYVVDFKLVAFLRGPHWLNALIAAVAVLPAAARRLRTRAALVLVVVGGAAATAISRSPHLPLAIGFVIYLAPLRVPRREALWLLTGTVLALAAGLGASDYVANVTDLPGDRAGLLLQDGLLVAAAWAAGYAVRQQRAYAASAQEQAEQRAREQLAEARRISSEERLQIARELHDVVAHTVSLIAVEAGVANYVVATHPEEAARALSSIEETSRGALREMRTLLGMLRADGTAESGERDTGLAPAPGLAALDILIERTAEAGLQVELQLHGERRELSAGLDLAAYRVIQEAITNVIKHAATDKCRVAVSYRWDMLVLQVTDGGSGAVSGDGCPGSGHGLVGMRERVGMYGGEFRAASLPGRGFQVTARFPLTGTES